MLKIVRITNVIDKWHFEAEDVFTGEAIDLPMSGKMKMNYIKQLFIEGDECVVQCSASPPFKGRIVTPSNFKMTSDPNKRWSEQSALAARYKEVFGAYEADAHWFHRPR